MQIWEQAADLSFDLFVGGPQYSESTGFGEFASFANASDLVVLVNGWTE